LVSTCRVAACLDAERLVAARLVAACLVAEYLTAALPELAFADIAFPDVTFPDVTFPDGLAVALPALVPAIDTIIPAAKATAKNALGLMTSQPWIMNVHTSNLL
jgi:hypothetical protein